METKENVINYKFEISYQHKLIEKLKRERKRNPIGVFEYITENDIHTKIHLTSKEIKEVLHCIINLKADALKILEQEHRRESFKKLLINQ